MKFSLSFLLLLLPLTLSFLPLPTLLSSSPSLHDGLIVTDEDITTDSQTHKKWQNPYHQGMNLHTDDSLSDFLSTHSDPTHPNTPQYPTWKPNIPPTPPTPSSSTLPPSSPPGTGLLSGTGIYDVTGEVAEIGFMGYAVPSQTGKGLLFRSRARAFIFADPVTLRRVVFVSMDLCMGFQIINDGVIDQLQSLYGPSLYTHRNVMISGTHTHATPGGIGGTGLVDLTTLGFIKKNYDAAVNGIVQAIVLAHENLQPVVLSTTVSLLDNTNINRSPSAYLLNPDRYQYVNNTDHEFTLLRITNPNGTELGSISWFAVHGTSLNNTNPYVSGDNKGHAAILLERYFNGPQSIAGMGPYVGAYGQSNEGDVSPNTKGPVCINDGNPCDFNTSTCNGKCQNCIASGPGKDQYDSMRIIGRNQYEKTKELYSQTVPLSTQYGVMYSHAYFNMENITVLPKYTGNSTAQSTCLCALGYAFAGGTTDGPGDFDFHQGTTKSNPFWNIIVDLIAKPTEEQIKCQYPKPILLDTGVIRPIQFSSYILPEQIFRIGNLWILGVPGEFTTMSGRRLRGMIQNTLIAKGEWYSDSHIVIAGLSNSYSHYIATYEEYQQQRYEGASSLYGPWTLAAHMQNFDALINTLLSNETTIDTGATPIDMRNHTFSFMPGVVVDTLPAGVSVWGQIVRDAESQYQTGQQVVISLWGASPRNDLMTQKSFIYVEMLSSNGNTWIIMDTDGGGNTIFRWERSGIASSLITITWNIPTDQMVEEGVYRIRHEGVRKTLTGGLVPYEGISAQFKVTNGK